MAERIKDGWNKELEENVRGLQNVDWNGVRTRVEEGVGSAWGRLFQGVREEVPEARR